MMASIQPRHIPGPLRLFGSIQRHLSVFKQVDEDFLEPQDSEAMETLASPLGECPIKPITYIQLLEFGKRE